MLSIKGVLYERGVLLRPEANELRTGFADHTQNEAGTEQVQPRDQEASIRRTDNFRQECHNAKTHREKTKMTREYKEDPMIKDKGKSIGQKQVEQMKRTREMSKEERKQSKKNKQKESEGSGREVP